jgi:rhodanese-related sulfurtransferase
VARDRITSSSVREQNRSMQVDEFSTRRAEFHLLDVREDDEWNAGHIDGAQHIPLRQLADRIGELPKERTVVAVCRSGVRSEAAARGLRKLGYAAENLEGGVNAWDRAKLPLVDGNGGRGRVI